MDIVEKQKKISYSEKAAQERCQIILAYVDKQYGEVKEIAEELDKLVSERSDQDNLQEAIKFLLRQDGNENLSQPELMDKLQQDVEACFLIELKEGKITSDNKNDFYDSHIRKLAKNNLQKKYMEQHMNADYNANFDRKRNKGYCTVPLMKAIETANEDKILNYFLPSDKEISAHPDTLVRYFETAQNGKFANKVHHTGVEHKTLDDLIKNNQIQPGAIVVLTMRVKEGEEANLDGFNHSIMFTGTDLQTGICKFISFDNERKDWEAKKFSSGYVIDTFGLIRQAEEERQKTRNMSTYSTIKKSTTY